MDNENLSLRLQAVELAISRLATSITENGGQSSTDLKGHILYFRERLGRGDLDLHQEQVFEQTLALLDPLSPKPCDEF